MVRKSNGIDAWFCEMTIELRWKHRDLQILALCNNSYKDKGAAREVGGKGSIHTVVHRNHHCAFLTLNVCHPLKKTPYAFGSKINQ